MGMALVDRALRAAGARRGPVDWPPRRTRSSCWATADAIEATGFVEHLKLPHYVDFQSELETVRRLRREAAATAVRTDAPAGAPRSTDVEAEAAR